MDHEHSSRRFPTVNLTSNFNSYCVVVKLPARSYQCITLADLDRLETETKTGSRGWIACKLNDAFNYCPFVS
jgi:hypothetical protein